MVGGIFYTPNYMTMTLPQDYAKDVLYVIEKIERLHLYANNEPIEYESYTSSGDGPGLRGTYGILEMLLKEGALTFAHWRYEPGTLVSNPPPPVNGARNPGVYTLLVNSQSLEEIKQFYSSRHGNKVGTENSENKQRLFFMSKAGLIYRGEKITFRKPGADSVRAFIALVENWPAGGELSYDEVAEVLRMTNIKLPNAETHSKRNDKIRKLLMYQGVFQRGRRLGREGITNRVRDDSEQPIIEAISKGIRFSNPLA